MVDESISDSIVKHATVLLACQDMLGVEHDAGWRDIPDFTPA
jgi:hypothetical protein